MSNSNISSAIQHLKLAQDCFEDFTREHKGSKGAALFAGYIKRIKWIHEDLMLSPHLPQGVREGIKQEIKADMWTIHAIQEKLSLVPPKDREAIEQLIDLVLGGESIIVENNSHA
jgi:hypothetical protein